MFCPPKAAYDPVENTDGRYGIPMAPFATLLGQGQVCGLNFPARAGIDKLAPHDLRRTCARRCHQAGGELDQIQFLLGHVSIQTTERYLGCKQKLRIAVNDRLGIEPDVA